MRNSTRILMVAIGFVVSASVFAAAQDESTESPEMPMMNQGGNMMMNPQMMNPGGNMMMNPDMMQQMMSQMPQMGYGQGYGMPMMGHGMGNMMMNPQMMRQMPHMGYGQGYGMPMMGQGMGNMMMNPQMMQMRMQHMQKME
ncbi:MAG: hypothetical protein KJN95_11105, partial [Gammaproteobacteria bacterium]|nr:hypothetical protein [Gammaproteobacteria bacterium]